VDLFSAKLTQGVQQSDRIISAQYSLYLVARHDRQLVDAIVIHFCKGIYQLCFGQDALHFLDRDHRLGGGGVGSINPQYLFNIMQSQ
jgi:hypothetical protein